MSLASAAALALSYVLMWQDARDGGHEVWPVDAFAASALFAAATWGYLVASYVTNKK